MNLVLRIVSALVLLPVVVTALTLGGHFATAIVLFATFLCLWEYGDIVSRKNVAMRVTLLVTGMAVSAAALLHSMAAGLLIAQLSLLVTAGLFTFRVFGEDKDWGDFAALAAGPLYVGMGITAIGILRGQTAPSAPLLGLGFIWLAMIATWSNDTFAYFAGRAFGKHKLYEAVSPNKTWEGFAGGVFGSLAMPFAFTYGFRALGVSHFDGFTAVDLVAIGLPAAVLAPVGDLIESRLKRAYGVKDSGKVIPGHGGILDRVDALIVVIPWVLTYAMLLR